MGSIRFSGVEFRCYPDDHPPPHVHGFYAETELILDLRSDGNVAVADRKDAIRPRNASRSEVRRIQRIASVHHAVLIALWEELHGKANGR